MSDLVCYERVIREKNYSQTCNFYEIKKNVSSFKLDIFSESSTQINKWKLEELAIMIDNSPFPFGGAEGDQDMDLQYLYSFAIEPTNTFYFCTEICKRKNKLKIIRIFKYIAIKEIIAHIN